MADRCLARLSTVGALAGTPNRVLHCTREAGHPLEEPGYITSGTPTDKAHIDRDAGQAWWDGATGAVSHGEALTAGLLAAGLPRPFHLVRDVDHTGLSGTGVVAEGVLFTDGRVAIRWVGSPHASTVTWDRLADVEAIHGHGGATRVEWLT